MLLWGKFPAFLVAERYSNAWVNWQTSNLINCCCKKFLRHLGNKINPSENEDRILRYLSTGEGFLLSTVSWRPTFQCLKKTTSSRLRRHCLTGIIPGRFWRRKHFHRTTYFQHRNLLEGSIETKITNKRRRFLCSNFSSRFFGLQYIFVKFFLCFRNSHLCIIPF